MFTSIPCRESSIFLSGFDRVQEDDHCEVLHIGPCTCHVPRKQMPALTIVVIREQCYS